VKAKNLKTLADLRQWHAQQCEHFRAMEVMHTKFADTGPAKRFGVDKTYADRAVDYKKQADFHMKAIQLLNDVCEGTVTWVCDGEVKS
jgi:hypothetical protein